eukprot:COSAG04_NODE_9377_length_869_cov_1.135065_1_plen_190_part_00
MDLVGQVEGCDCILVDDMIDTAGTLCSAADELQAMGARSVYAYATHGCVCLALARRCCWIQARCCGWIEMLTRGRRAGCSTRRRSTASKTRCESEPSARLFHCPGAETWGARAVLGRSGGGKHDSAAGTHGLRRRELRACLRVPPSSLGAGGREGRGAGEHDQDPGPVGGAAAGGGARPAPPLLAPPLT